MTNKINYKNILLILLLSVVLGFIYNTFSVNGINLIRKPILVKSVTLGEAENELNNILGLDLAQALTFYNKNLAIFIDARDQWDFAEAHIKGAINIPEFSFTKDDSLLKSISNDNLLLVYCDGDDCDTSKRLANEIVKLGYKNVYVFLGGLKEWKEAQLPISISNDNE